MNLKDIGASSTINGLCLTKDNQQHDHFITVNHLKEKCTSNQLFKYILYVFSSLEPDYNTPKLLFL